MKFRPFLNVALAAAASACASSVSCPGDLREVSGACVCPTGTSLRSAPETDPFDGARRVCEPTEPDSDGGPGGTSSGSADAGSADAASTGAPGTTSSGSGVSDAAAYPATPSDGAPPGVAPPALAPGPMSCPTPTIWYRDCDGDGFAAAAGGAVSSCAPPAAPPACAGWTATAPTPGRVDCNDQSAEYAPGAGAGLAGDGDGDRNCDGMIEQYVERVASPSVVDLLPRRDAPFCSYGNIAEDACNCFDWPYSPLAGPVRSRPPCAKTRSDAFTAGYRAFMPQSGGMLADAEVCERVGAGAQGSVAIYELLTFCR